MHKPTPDFTKPHTCPCIKSNTMIRPQWFYKGTILVQQGPKLAIYDTLIEDDLKCLKFNFFTKYWSDLNQILNSISGGLTKINKSFTNLLEEGPKLPISWNAKRILRGPYQKRMQRPRLYLLCFITRCICFDTNEDCEEMNVEDYDDISVSEVKARAILQTIH